MCLSFPSRFASAPSPPSVCLQNFSLSRVTSCFCHCPQPGIPSTHPFFSHQHAKSGKTETNSLGSLLKSQNTRCTFHSIFSLPRENLGVGSTWLFPGEGLWEGQGQGSEKNFPTCFLMFPHGFALTWGAATA